MERDERLYPISEDLFNEVVLPIIRANRRGKGRPPKVSHYLVFRAILYVISSCLLLSKYSFANSV
jgi:hypothetical protein